jgi:hypothetical protein
MGMKNRIVGTVAAFAFFAITSPASANLIVNGGFDFPTIGTDFYQNYGTFTDAPYTGPSFQGWTVKPGTNVDIVNPSNPGAWSASAYQGVQVLDLVGYGDTGGIQQKFATVFGQKYVFSFEYANNPGNGEAGAAASFHIFGASPLLSGIVTHNTSGVGNLDWTLYTGTFVANSPITGLRFDTTFGANNGGILLDAVTVSAVPEASTWIMMLIGFAGIGFASYRRAKKASLASA